MGSVKLSVVVIMLFTVFSMGVFAAGDGESAAAGEPLEIRIMNRVNSQVSFEDNPMIEEIERRTNTKIVYEAPPIKSWTEKQNLVMASGDLPDIMYDWSLGANYEKWSVQGLFVDLDPYDVRNASKYPNINGNVTGKHWQHAEVPPRDFHVFAVPRSHYVASWGPAYRKDWLEKVGLPYPETLEEFEQVCEAFVKDDPDGNGRDDTYAFTMIPSDGPGNVRFLWGITGFYANSRFDPSTGKLYLREEHPSYEGFIKYLRRAYQKGWLDPEFVTNKTYSDRDKFLQGKIGLYDAREGELVVINGMNPDVYKTVVYGAPPRTDANELYINMWPPSIWGGWCIAGSSESKTEGILSFIDYMYSMDGRILNALGIQGEHYNGYDPETRILDITSEQFEAVQSVTSIYMVFARADANGVELVDPGAGTPMFNVIQSGLEHYRSHSKLIWVPVTKELDTKFREFDEARPELRSDLAEAEYRYIMGEIGESDWKAAAQAMLSAAKQAGLDEALQAVAPKYSGIMD